MKRNFNRDRRAVAEIRLALRRLDPRLAPPSRCEQQIADMIEKIRRAADEPVQPDVRLAHFEPEAIERRVARAMKI